MKTSSNSACSSLFCREQTPASYKSFTDSQQTPTNKYGFYHQGAQSGKRLLQHLSLLKFSWAKAIALWFLDLISINYQKMSGHFSRSPGGVIRHCGCLMPNFVDVQPPKWWHVWIPATTGKFFKKKKTCLLLCWIKKIQQQVLGFRWPSRLEASVVSSEDSC